MKNNENEYTYTVYYFNANFGQDNVDDTIDLLKDIVHIKSQDGNIINTETVNVKTGIKV